MNFLEKIFSIKPLDAIGNIEITVCGIKFKVKKNAFSGKYRKMPVVNNRIIFNNFNGKGFGCNPKYIALEILNKKLPYELAWIVKDDNELLPKGIKAINYNSEELLEYLSTARIIVSNCRLYDFVKAGFVKKAEQIYIQTWHGALSFKKIEKDIEHSSHNNKYLKIAKTDSKYIDYLLSPSKFDTKCLKHNFYFDGKFLEMGCPRNDLFFYNENKKNEIKNKVYKKLNILNDKGIILYAPTFRDSGNLDMYKIDINALLRTLRKKYNRDFVFVSRLHPNMLKKSNKMSELLPNSINASHYDDIQELLLATDILITDYSSCMFDFALSEKPCFIFATDIKDYLNERGFYYSLDSTPFPIARSNDELSKNIEEFDNINYNKNIKLFLLDKGSFEDGHASEKIANLIKTNIGDNK